MIVIWQCKSLGYLTHKAYFEQTDDVRAGLNKLDWSVVSVSRCRLS